MKKRDCTIIVAKTKASLFSHNADCWFSSVAAHFLEAWWLSSARQTSKQENDGAHWPSGRL